MNTINYKNLLLFQNFYESLSDNVFPFPTSGTNSFYNIDSALFNSLQGTISSITLVLKAGRINDAYALTRKYFDSVIINIYISTYIKNEHSFEKYIVEKIEKWRVGKEKLPKFETMIKYIESKKSLGLIGELYFGNKNMENIRIRCNDHTHNNGLLFFLLNNNELPLIDKESIFKTILNDIKEIFVFHISSIFYINNHYMMSSDYTDSLDMGLTPVENSQYWVAPFIQDIFDEIFKKEYSVIFNILKDNTVMQIE